VTVPILFGTPIAVFNAGRFAGVLAEKIFSKLPILNWRAVLGLV
jgi:hypothetical protein